MRLHGLAIEIQPISFLSKNGAARLFRAFGVMYVKHFSNRVRDISFRRLLFDH